eukprot:TRINITY_DN3454_c0_g1_i1.p1 TRINITY_DN3454_c0_g1~~TRINITY_DN3454_c0_g1_i1.p1  ORF type:complete len:212 (+),score=62.55 TRINITY_DN3454_c0_g1_i1:44-637(+)
MKIILGTSSKWRRQLFVQAFGEPFQALSADIDEKKIRPGPGETIYQLPLMIAEAKLSALLEQNPQIHGLDATLLTFDQVIICNGELREKPETKEEAFRYLKSYGEHPAECVNGVVAYNLQTKALKKELDISKQYFLPIPDSHIEKLLEDPDFFTCAGGFIVDHVGLKDYVGKTEGEIESVQGFPKSLVSKLLQDVKS